MNINQIFIFFAVLLMVSCKMNPRECDNYTPFEDTPGLRQYYAPEYSFIFLPENQVQIKTYFDGNDFTREGTYEFEIDLIECYCGSGIDEDGNCLYPTARYFGTGSIDITTSNDSICHAEKFDLSFEITQYESQISISDGDCFNIIYHDRN